MNVINLECRAGMRALPSNSISSIVTDPPYGLSKHPNMQEVLKHWLAGDDFTSNGRGFMGKEWDSFVPCPATWREAYRVLKPGGYLAAFAGSRTQDLMATSLRLAGFHLVDCLFWFYGSGMPKSMDIAKAFDRRKHDRDQILTVTAWIAKTRDANGVTNKAIDEAFGMAGHWTSQASQPSVPTLEQVPRLSRVLGVDEPPEDIKRLLLELNAAKGQPGENWAKREVIGKHEKCAPTAGWRQTYQGGNAEAGLITKSHSDIAKQWEGWGTGLKPCYEPIILCRKPLDGTFANNIENHGVGGLNIDGCRLPDGGRWPPNVMHDGCLPEPMDRYFYCAKATRADRDAGLEAFEHVSAGEVTGGRAEGSVGINNGRAGAGRTSGGKNTHPTVKPTDLMRWLCRMVTPPGGTVLDPFSGSGSTGRGAVLEGFNFMGFELDVEYARIANARIKACR